ncbi:MAG: hypothetical protein WEB58_17225 [Planctomycetaceae bacterium]
MIKTVQIHATEFPNAGEALQYVDASGVGRAIRCDEKYLVVDEAELRRIETEGVPFALLSDHAMPNGSFRIMTVPVND